MADPNVRLIAAAPKMLKALKAVEEWWLRDGMRHHTGAPGAIFDTRAVIAEIEGAAMIAEKREEP